MIVGDQRDRLVAQPGTGFHQSPAQVDVFTGAHALVETADVGEDVTSADDRSARHIRHCAVRDDRSLTPAEIER